MDTLVNWPDVGVEDAGFPPVEEEGLPQAASVKDKRATSISSEAQKDKRCRVFIGITLLYVCVM
jgi:hypothetical protein